MIEIKTSEEILYCCDDDDCFREKKWVSLNSLVDFLRRNSALIGSKNKDYAKGWKNAMEFIKETIKNNGGA